MTPNEEELKKIQWVDTADCVSMPELGRIFYDPKHYSQLRSAMYQEGWDPSYPARAILTNGKPELFVGVHRLKIAKEIGIARIPYVLDITMTRPTAILKGIKSNTLQGPYNPIDISNHLNSVQTSGQLSIREIAASTNMSFQKVHAYISLSRLPESIKELVGTGKMKMYCAIAMLELPDDVDKERMAERCIRECWTVSKTEQNVKYFLEHKHDIKNEYSACPLCAKSFPKENMTELKPCFACTSKLRELKDRGEFMHKESFSELWAKQKEIEKVREEIMRLK